MTDPKDDVDHHRHGKYFLSSNNGSGADNNITFNTEELATACRRLGITGPLDSLLRELKIQDSPVTCKESPRKSSQKKEKRSSSRSKEANDVVEAYLENSLLAASKVAKNSFGQESWGRDSGARDLSPEPQRGGGLDALGTMQQHIAEADVSGSSQMIHLASKVRDFSFIYHNRHKAGNLIQ